jgi:predicted P-loop ATPase
MSTPTNQQLQAAAQQLNFQQPVFPDMTANGKPKGTLSNFKTLFAHYGINIKYNEMTKEQEISIPGFKNTGDLLNNAVLGKLVDLCQQNDLQHRMLDYYVTLVAHENQYHPVRDWIDSIVWDGQDHLQSVYDSIILDEVDPMKQVKLRKWLLSLAAALYHTNFKCEGVLTMVSGQGVGKTTFIEELIPKASRANWNRSGVTLDVQNKDSLFKALGAWITELGELGSTFRKSDIEALKGFTLKAMIFCVALMIVKQITIQDALYFMPQ